MSQEPGASVLHSAQIPLESRNGWLLVMPILSTELSNLPAISEGETGASKRKGRLVYYHFNGSFVIFLRVNAEEFDSTDTILLCSLSDRMWLAFIHKK